MKAISNSPPDRQEPSAPLESAARDHQEEESRRLLEEFSHLNNALATAQRELARKNCELQQARDELERRVEERTAELSVAKGEAERANAAKSQFLSRLSHELRTPLNAILGFGQLLEMRDLGEREKLSVAHILKGGRHLLTLVDEILDISGIETGRLRLSLEPVAVREVIGEALDLMRPTAAPRHIQLDGEAALSFGGYVLADRERLKLALLNLLSNAVKFNRDGGSVTVSCEIVEPSPTAPLPWGEGWSVRGEGHLRLSVRDTGCGLTAQELSQLFVPFERLHAARTTIEGTGIGLVLSKSLIEAMHGRLGVESVAGQGSIFWIELPLAVPPALPESEFMNALR